MENVKQYVYLLLDKEPSSKLDLQIEMIVEECLAYCYRKDIPENMEKPLADVVASEINRKGVFALEGDITSYREGDMSVSFGQGATTNGLKYNGKLEGFKQIIGIVQNVQKS